MFESNLPSVPANTRRILCLANSRKLSGRCIAGREILHDRPGSWIRPVSARERQEVSEEERRYQDGRDPAVLDVIDVPLIESQPWLFQQENWLLDPNFYWQKSGRCDWAGLKGFLDTSAPLWINGQNSYSGLNDRIALIQSEQLRSSLRLIRVESLTVEVCRPGAVFNNPRRRLQGQFVHLGIHYWLWVTDPVYEQRYLAQPDGRYELGESCLTISLGEPKDGFCYKLIAAIIERAHTETR